MNSVIKDFHFAWKTVVLSLVFSITWIVSIVLYLTNFIPFHTALFGCVISAYVNFTPMHEASHGNIKGRFKKFKFIEYAIGYLSSAPLFVPFPIFKHLHLQHHSFTNHQELDPDFWVASRNPIVLIFKLLTIKPHYYFHALIKPRTAVRRERPKILLIIGAYLGQCFIVQYFFGKGFELFLLWTLSAVLALAILALVFDWLPHTPHAKIGRYIDTSIIDNKILTYPMLYQNYHLCHHLYPRVPFYNYKKVFMEFEQEMIDKGSKIYK